MPPPTTNPASAAITTLFAAVADKARAAAVFGEVSIKNNVLTATAKASAEPAEYRLFIESNVLWVALVTEHRWLSQSIEADLVHTGDKLNELIREELINLGWENFAPTFEHFRDEKKLYTFRTRLTPPLDLARAADAETVNHTTLALLAYEATFRMLGDMEADDDE